MHRGLPGSNDRTEDCRRRTDANPTAFVNYHVLRLSLDRRADEVAAGFDDDTSGWLRGFLRIATVGLSSRHGIAPAIPWYRLGPRSELEDGAVAIAFVWWPHLGASTFEQFHGRFVVTAEGGRSTIGLEGVAEGGDPDQSDETLASLLGLLVAAFSVDPGTDADQRRG